ncbi:GTP cyclohydrolase FolE2 [bacterium]|nr:GTP cyclohydrolase FolE2 [bacterium]
MEDTQSKSDFRKVAINKVGIKNIQYPIVVTNRRGIRHNTVGTFAMYVNLQHDQKGTHMSRFVEILNEYKGNINLQTVENIIDMMKEKLDAEQAFLHVRFPYFLEKEAPVTRSKSYMNYEVRLDCKTLRDTVDTILAIDVPVTTLCPCSKSISEYGAHNQRGLVTVCVRFHDHDSQHPMDIDDLIHLVEQTSSCEVFALLKREDEKYVTEQAYENPVFVEDLVRDIALSLSSEKRISWYSVEVTNFESIHNHDAYAYIERDKSNSLHVTTLESANVTSDSHS